MNAKPECSKKHLPHCHFVLPKSIHLTQRTEAHSFLCLPSICCYLPKSHYISDQYEDEGRSTVTALSDRNTPTILSVRSYNQNLARDSGVESRAVGGIFIWTAGTCRRLAGSIYMASGHRMPRSYDLRILLYNDLPHSTWVIRYKSITAYSGFLYLYPALTNVSLITVMAMRRGTRQYGV
jgi:hypothetical protein